MAEKKGAVRPKQRHRTPIVDGPAYVAFAVDRRGRRRRIVARSIVVDVGGGTEIQIALFASTAGEVGKLWMLADGNLVISPGAGNLVYVSVELTR